MKVAAVMGISLLIMTKYSVAEEVTRYVSNYPIEKMDLCLTDSFSHCSSSYPANTDQFLQCMSEWVDPCASSFPDEQDYIGIGKGVGLPVPEESNG